jgi:isopenicillin N synthase-like dioxygenase
MDTREKAIPLIDISGYLAGDESSESDAAQQVNEALERVGFFTVAGHDIDWQLVEDIYAEARRFHDLPLTAKEQLAADPKKLGYFGLGQGRSIATAVEADARKPNLNEAFLLSSAESLGINQWPALPGFREATLEYVNVTMALAYKLTRLVGVALELGADYFAPFFDADCGTLRLSHYPVVEHEENQWGLAAHTDSNFFTLLPTNDVAGLSIRPDGSDWIDADVPARCFLVNSGYILRRWTNNRYLATEHRVKNVATRDRYAIPMFYRPRGDTLITALSTCVSPERPPEYESIIYQEYRDWFINVNYFSSGTN